MERQRAEQDQLTSQQQKAINQVLNTQAALDEELVSNEFVCLGANNRVDVLIAEILNIKSAF